MSGQRDFERSLRDWLAEGPTLLSGEALAETMAAIARTSQVSGPRRWPVAIVPGRQRRWSLVAVVVVALLALAFVILRPPFNEQTVAPPSASPAPAPTATTPTPAASASSGVLPVGPLPAGTYTSTVMIPSVTFTTPTQLILRYEKTENVWLATGYALGAPEFNVLRSDETGILDRLIGDARVSATQPVNVTIGGIRGRAVDVSVPAGAYAPQVRNLYSADAVIVTGLREAQWYVYLLPGFKAHLIELTVSGKHVLIFWQAPAEQDATWSNVAQQIAASLQFPGGH